MILFILHKLQLDAAFAASFQRNKRVMNFEFMATVSPTEGTARQGIAGQKFKVPCGSPHIFFFFWLWQSWMYFFFSFQLHEVNWKQKNNFYGLVICQWQPLWESRISGFSKVWDKPEILPSHNGCHSWLTKPRWKLFSHWLLNLKSSVIGLSHNSSQSQPSILNFKQFANSNFLKARYILPHRWEKNVSVWDNFLDKDSFGTITDTSFAENSVRPLTTIDLSPCFFAVRLCINLTVTRKSKVCSPADEKFPQRPRPDQASVSWWVSSNSRVLFSVICAGTGQAQSTVGFLFQKYVHISFSMKMGLNCSYLICRFVCGQGQRHQEGNWSKCDLAMSNFALAWDFWRLSSLGSCATCVFVWTWGANDASSLEQFFFCWGTFFSSLVVTKSWRQKHETWVEENVVTNIWMWVFVLRGIQTLLWDKIHLVWWDETKKTWQEKQKLFVASFSSLENYLWEKMQSWARNVCVVAPAVTKSRISAKSWIKFWFWWQNQRTNITGSSWENVKDLCSK